VDPSIATAVHYLGSIQSRPTTNDMAKMDRILVDDLQLRGEISSVRLERRAKLRTVINQGMDDLEKATDKYALDDYYRKALSLVISGNARRAFDLKLESDATRDQYGRNTFGQSCLLARRLIEAGTRFVEVNWPKVANSDNHSWDVHTGLSKRMKDQSAPMLDAGLSALIADLDQRGMLNDTLVVAVGEFGRSPQKGVSTSGNNNSADGRDHWPYCFTSVIAGDSSVTALKGPTTEASGWPPERKQGKTRTLTRPLRRSATPSSFSTRPSSLA
jgi:hypothetical protein